MIYGECIKMWRELDSIEILDAFFRKFTYSSNKLENDETRLRDVEAIFNLERVSDFNESEKTIKEIENHRELYQNIFKLNKEVKTKLTMEIIEQVYFILTGDKVAREVYGSINKLVQDINNMKINDDNALEVVSYFYCYFQTISNCDGRVSRMLLNYLLIANNLPPITIFYVDKEEYYLALDYFNETQVVDKMIKFLDDQAYKTWLKDYNLKLRSLKDFLEE
ncbi:MAG: Fic family protein [Clostridiaceae bacterium]|nr:Fic family protein [Clostridiaceae bacterium]